MSGPIVRTGASAKFSQNWDRIFSAPSTKSKTKTADKPSKAGKAAAAETMKAAAPTAKAKAGKATAKTAAKGKSKK